ncbi:30S ribosomal protein S7 [Candidatus Gracilibacteria bacterium]|nr:30S ribosomal protein S7 [Candidatus Gracilibacteria bacterium]
MFKFIPTGSTPLQEKFINCLMKDGKKTVARKILSSCFEELKTMGHKNPVEAFEKALNNVMPHVEVRAKRVGGAVYQIPVEVSDKRQVFLAIGWILNSARGKKGLPMHKRLAIELNDALSDTGGAFKKKEEVLKMAHANKAFAHFARY